MVRRSTPTDELTSALEKHRECLNMALLARSGGQNEQPLSTSERQFSWVPSVRFWQEAAGFATAKPTAVDQPAQFWNRFGSRWTSSSITSLS